MGSDPKLRIRRQDPGQEAFRGLDPRKPLPRHGLPVGDAGGQAGLGRLVPREEPPFPGEGADLGLGQPRLQQGTADAVQLGKRPHPGTVVAAVVRVRSVQKPREAALPRPFGHTEEPHPFADVAAVRRIDGESGVRELVHLDHKVIQLQSAGEPKGVLPLVRGQQRGDDGDGRTLPAEHVMGLGGQQGAVDAAREGDGRAADPPQQLMEPLQLFSRPFSVCSPDHGNVLQALRLEIILWGIISLAASERKSGPGRRAVSPGPPGRGGPGGWRATFRTRRRRTEKAAP